MEQMKHLITPTEIRELGRPIGQVEDEQIEAYIDETEQLYVKPMLGDGLYLTLLGYVEQTSDVEDPNDSDDIDIPDDADDEGVEGFADTDIPEDIEEPGDVDTPEDIEQPEENSNAENYALLLSGGRYTTEDEAELYFNGLRVAMSYYVYAQNIMSGDFQSTRYGMVIKDNDYSHPLTGRERSNAYNNALAVANRYMGECVAFCKEKQLIKAGGRRKATGSIRIRKIG